MLNDQLWSVSVPCVSAVCALLVCALLCVSAVCVCCVCLAVCACNSVVILPDHTLHSLLPSPFPRIVETAG